jgi:hypothetical protein
MNPVHTINTLDLLNTSYEGIHVILHNMFRLMKPVRRKYKLSCNSLIVLNAIYLYHKHKGSVFPGNSICQWLRYYDLNKVKWYFDYLLRNECLIKAEVIKSIQYYKITEKGITVMNDFANSFQEVLSKWYNDYSIVVS